jgi:menaquinol-cytochrome c reductase iron-sulfur subunit
VAEDRRTLLKVLSGVVGTSLVGAVAAPALRAALAPVTLKTVTGVGELVPVVALEAVPADGTPIQVPVVVEAPMDAWTRHPPTTVGAVFLVRRGDEVRAWSSICPHLGCGIDYDARVGKFGCPCHESWFDAEGQVASGPAPRGMDTLETRIVDGVVEVRFEKFKIGTAEKAPA